MGVGNSSAENLSETEVQLIRSSWKVVMKNPEDNGIFIFKTFLEKYNYYGYFKKFSQIPIEELPKHYAFRKHSGLIIHALNNVALHIGDNEQLRNELNILGKMHRAKNVTEMQFQELKTVLLEILETRFKLEEQSMLAWNKALTIAFAHIYEVLN